MASISEEFTVDASPDEVWDALRDWGALDERLAAGFVTAARLDGDDRIVTFFTGIELRERLVTRDDDARRLVWTIVDGPYAHHNGAAQVLAEDDGRARFVWTADLLPDEAAPRTAEMMSAGARAMKRTLERSGAVS